MMGVHSSNTKYCKQSQVFFPTMLSTKFKQFQVFFSKVQVLMLGNFKYFFNKCQVLKFKQFQVFFYSQYYAQVLKYLIQVF